MVTFLAIPRLNRPGNNIAYIKYEEIKQYSAGAVLQPIKIISRIRHPAFAIPPNASL